MPLLDDYLVGSQQPITPTKDPEDHASHAAAPQAFTKATAKELIFALAGLMALIYGVHVAGRVVKA